MTSALTINTELMTASETALLAISFVKSSSYIYAPAVEIAKSAMHHQEKSIGKSVVHYAVFGKSREEAATAMCLIDHTRQWASTQIYGGGQLIQNKHHAKSVLECYLNAMSCSDKQAHCCYVYSLGARSDNVLIPCNMLNLWFRYNPHHPSTGRAQLEACAVKRGVNWCPLLNYSDFRKL